MSDDILEPAKRQPGGIVSALSGLMLMGGMVSFAAFQLGWVSSLKANALLLYSSIECHIVLFDICMCSFNRVHNVTRMFILWVSVSLKGTDSVLTWQCKNAT